MEKAHLIYKGDFGFYKNLSTNLKIGYYADFLETECRDGFFSSFFKEWALDSKQDITTGNINQLIKYKNNIYISEFDDDFELDQDDNSLPTGVEYEFKISIEEFIKSLDEWGKILLLDPQPKEIIIKQDDEGEISFETIF